MGIILLFITAIMWSMVGVLVKLASTMVDSSAITLSRFLFGVIFLTILILVQKRRLVLHWKSKWIWYGVIGKCCNYFFENIALSIGYAYGNIVVLPLITIILVLVSAFYFKEKILGKDWTASAMCITGAFLISWNGLPLSAFAHTNLLITSLFILSAIGASFHFLSQKVLIKTMDPGPMNLSVFFWSTLITALPLPFTFKMTGPFNIWALLALMGLGLITGVSFYIYASALKKVPFIAAIIIGNSSILFTLIWSRLFYNEPITWYIVTGALLFLIGITILNIPMEILKHLKIFYWFATNRNDDTRI